MLELIVVMDACKLKIAMGRAKCLEKDNGELEAKLHSQTNNLKLSTKTIKYFQLSILELSCHAPITQEQVEDL